MNERRLNKSLDVQQLDDNKYIVSNRKTGKTYEIGWKEYGVLKLIDGNNSPADISDICGYYNVDEVTALEEEFNKIGFLEEGKSSLFSINILKIKYSLVSPTEYFKSRKQINILYWINTLFYVIFGSLAIFQSIIRFINGTDNNRMEMIKAFDYTSLGFSIKDIVIVYLIIVLTFFLHEFSHMITALYYGIRVSDMGFMFYFFIPCAYTNLTHLHYCNNKKNVLHVLSAGMLMDFGIMGLFMTMFNYMPISNATRYYLYIVLFSMVSLLGNLIIFLKFDGYFILQVLIDETNLMENAKKISISTVASCITTVKNKNKRVRIQNVGDESANTYFFIVYASFLVLYVPLVLASGVLSIIIESIGGH